ncbi:MAG: serine/threonine protein kinase [Planctomycetes bacterium]|nr:serine/threonine protein kinase [Planctomycetota bacterium]
MHAPTLADTAFARRLLDDGLVRPVELAECLATQAAARRSRGHEPPLAQLLVAARRVSRKTATAILRTLAHSWITVGPRRIAISVEDDQVGARLLAAGQICRYRLEAEKIVQGVLRSAGVPLGLAEVLARDGAVESAVLEGTLRLVRRDLGLSASGARSGAGQALPAAKAGDLVFGRFRLYCHLGSGGNADVFEAYDLVRERTVALKLLRPELESSPDSVERFAREARLLACVNHPNVVRVIESCVGGSRHFLLMEFVGGPSLEDVLVHLPSQRVAHVLRDAALGLAAMHREGILHRDVKPANILLGGRDGAVLCDAGIAKRVTKGMDPDLTGADHVIGTPDYLAPEQVNDGGAALPPACDQFPFGVMLYRHMVGTIPFPGQSGPERMVSLLTRQPSPPSEFARWGGAARPVPRALEAICMKCLRSDPADRYPSAEALAADLGRFVAGKRVAAERLGSIAADRLRAGWRRVRGMAHAVRDFVSGT